MRVEQAIANVELRSGDRRVKLRALVDTGASKSIISKKLADELKAFIPLDEPYDLRTADKNGKLRIIGQALVKVIFQGIEVPGRVAFEVAENLREDIQVVVGRPEIDAWDIVFTPEGPRPRKTPIEFEII